MRKLALGTVQFGSKYGVANHGGRVSLLQVKKILEQASKTGVCLLDTAISYGDSEERLGKIGVNEFNIVSKLPALPEGQIDIDSWVEKQVDGSLRRLRVPFLHGLLLHRPRDLLGDARKSLIGALGRLKLNGLVKKVGVSIYDPAELDDVMNLLQIDIVQGPLNIIDRRLETSGWLSKLHQEGVEIHTRSAFLQGLLLMSRDNIPAKFEAWKDLWDRWTTELQNKNISAAAVCLSYPLSLMEVDRVILGVDSIHQFTELIAASKVKLPKHDFSFMTSEDQMLINPSSWSGL